MRVFCLARLALSLALMESGTELGGLFEATIGVGFSSSVSFFVLRRWVDGGVRATSA